jgi:hypothetical protein
MSVPLSKFSADGNLEFNIGQPSPGCILMDTGSIDKLTILGFGYNFPILLGDTWDGTMEELDTNIFKVLHQYEQMLLGLNELSDKQSPSERREAFWPSLIWNADEDSKYPAPDDFGELYQEMTKLISRIFEWNKTADDPSHHQRVIPDGEAMRYYKALLRNGFQSSVLHYCERGPGFRSSVYA